MSEKKLTINDEVTAKEIDFYHLFKEYIMASDGGDMGLIRCEFNGVPGVALSGFTIGLNGETIVTPLAFMLTSQEVSEKIKLPSEWLTDPAAAR